MAYLDPVVQDFVADASRFIGPVEAMIKVVDDAKTAVAELQAEIAGLSGKNIDIGVSVKGISGAVRGAVAQITALKAAMRGLGDATVHVNTDMNGVGRSVVMMGGWFRMTGNALHWLVMGTLEIAATAIPALVAFGAAIAGMFPTFIGMKDHFTNLDIATGSFKNALVATGGPLGRMGALMGTLQQKLAPDAYIILGSAIDALSKHFGVFSHMAVQAGNVLARFAGKLSSELSGGLGNTLIKFFGDAVRLMTQWGQVIGNVAHFFINMMKSMWGVSKLLLTAFEAISRALVIISGNPVGQFFLGLIFAMSAVYRWGLLLVKIFRWLGAAAAFAWLKTVAMNMYAAAAATGTFRAALVTLYEELTLLISNPITLAIAAIAYAFGIWYLTTIKVSNATTDLIHKVQSMPQTVGNLTHGIAQLSSALARNEAMLHRAGHSAVAAGIQFGARGASGLSGGATAARFNINLLTKAITTQYRQLALLKIGLAATGGAAGQAGANLEALNIQLGLQDSQIQKVISAWDQYIGLATGGTSSLAQLALSIRQIGSVAASTSNHLSQSAGNMSLSVKQFAAAIAKGPIGSPQVWTNFDSVVGQSMQAVADWMQQAKAAGTITGTQFAKGILDMTSAMIKFAGHDKTAQAALVAFAKQSGLNINTFGQLKNAIKTSGANFQNLQGIIGKASSAMTNMEKIASNLSSVMQQQVAQAMVASALKTTNFSKDVYGLIKAQENNGTYGGRSTAQWAALVQRDTQQATNAVTQGSKLMVNAAKTAAGGWAGSAASMQQSMGKAAAAAHNTAAAITAIPKTWSTVYTLFIKQVGSTAIAPTGIGQHSTSGVRTSNAVFTPRHVIENHIYLDGNQIYNSVQQHAVRRQRRTGNNGLQRITR